MHGSVFVVVFECFVARGDEILILRQRILSKQLLARKTLSTRSCKNQGNVLYETSDPDSDRCDTYKLRNTSCNTVQFQLWIK